jgi:hypothetical protein
LSWRFAHKVGGPPGCGRETPAKRNKAKSKFKSTDDVVVDRRHSPVDGFDSATLDGAAVELVGREFSARVEIEQLSDMPSTTIVIFVFIRSTSRF